jgi:hypothetical protein
MTTMTYDVLWREIEKQEKSAVPDENAITHLICLIRRKIDVDRADTSSDGEVLSINNGDSFGDMCCLFSTEGVFDL